MAKTVLSIDGMSCGACSKRVEDALLDVEGVSDVKVDLKKGAAEVVHEGAGEEALVRAVLDAGFRSKVKRGLFR
ncbi:MAG: heavy-metal-associated domain-containing protein [Methanomassiliicoccaceae archaeon]|nr:heavy-metal-associated domain-containing protein [Methanomassiliicoccaceae archaeon]